MKTTIYAVDDDEDNNYALKIAMEGVYPNIEIVCVNGGKQCIELLATKPLPDLILLDIMMPEVTGWDVIKIIRETTAWKNIPIIVLTARNDLVAKKAGNFYGEYYVEKPYDLNDLKTKIDQVLKRTELTTNSIK